MLPVCAPPPPLKSKISNDIPIPFSNSSGESPMPSTTEKGKSKHKKGAWEIFWTRTPKLWWSKSFEMATSILSLSPYFNLRYFSCFNRHRFVPKWIYQVLSSYHLFVPVSRVVDPKWFFRNQIRIRICTRHGFKRHLRRPTLPLLVLEEAPVFSIRLKT